MGMLGGAEHSILARLRGQLSAGSTTAISSCLFYSIYSISMVLGNKFLMSHFHPCRDAPFALLAFQSVPVCLALLACRAAGLVTWPAFSWNTAWKWLPVNVGFVIMLQTGLMAVGLAA
eukprot:gene8571-7821_t